MRRILPLSLVAAVVAVAACGDTDISEPRLAPDALSEARQAATGPAGWATYRVTITNLTTAGQPFTPPLAVTHRKPASLFTVGSPASHALQEIAENGNLAPMVEWLSGAKHVADLVVAAGDPPPLFPGSSVSFDLSVERGAKYLSFVSMLICTNDGFTGIDGLRLPREVGGTGQAYTGAYDAGTEMNTEDFVDLVPPCPALTGVDTDDEGTGMSDPALAEGGVIRHHPGIQGVADLVPSLHGWENPVAHVWVERTG